MSKEYTKDTGSKKGRRGTDRRNTSNRRKSDNRRGVTNESTSSKSANDNVSDKKSLLGILISRVLLFITIAALFGTGLIVYIFSNQDNINYFVSKVSKYVIVKLEQASIDPASLTNRVCKARLTIGLKNNLPCNIIMTNLKYDISLAGYKIASGIQEQPMLVIPAKKYKRLRVKFHVDSIKTRRALQKAVRKNVKGILQIMLSKINGKTKAIANNIKGIIKVSGSAQYKISIHGVEIPFSKIIKFN